MYNEIIRLRGAGLLPAEILVVLSFQKLIKDEEREGFERYLVERRPFSMAALTATAEEILLRGELQSYKSVLWETLGFAAPDGKPIPSAKKVAASLQLSKDQLYGKFRHGQERMESVRHLFFPFTVFSEQSAKLVFRPSTLLANRWDLDISAKNRNRLQELHDVCMHDKTSAGGVISYLQTAPRKTLLKYRKWGTDTVETVQRILKHVGFPSTLTFYLEPLDNNLSDFVYAYCPEEMRASLATMQIRTVRDLFLADMPTRTVRDELLANIGGCTARFLGKCWEDRLRSVRPEVARLM